MLEQETLWTARHRPGLFQRLKSLIPHVGVDRLDFDLDYLLLSMADADPEFVGYFNDEGLPRQLNEATKNEGRSA